MAEKEKKVIKKEEATAKPTAEVKAEAKEAKKSSKHIENGRIYIKASFNNTAVSITDDRGNLIAWATAGGLGIFRTEESHAVRRFQGGSDDSREDK